MRRLWRITRWLAAGVLALVLMVIAAVTLFTRTTRFNDLLRARIVSYLAQTYRGQISIGAIEGSIWGALTLRDIEVRHHGSTIARIPQLRVGYQLLPALRGQFVLSDIDVIKPELHLAQDSGGQWNLLAAIAERNPSPLSPPPPPANITIAMRRFAIEQAAISVTTMSAATYRLSDGNFIGAGQIGLFGQSFNLQTIAFSLSGPGMLPVRAQGSLDYDEARQVASIKVPNFSISTSRSRIDLSATLRDLSARNLDATVNLRKLAAVDVNSLAPQANLARDISGTVQITGNPADLHGVVALTAGQAHIETNINADLTKSEPVWNLRAQLAKVDLRKLLKRKNPEELPAGLISATARADGTGISPASAKGGVDMRMTGFATAGMRLGDLSMAATVKNQVASLNLALAGPNGRARITGRVDIAKQPAYNLIISVEHLRPASLIRAAQIPRADLSLNATIDGSGYQSQTMRTRVRIGWLPSTLGGIRIDRGRVDANLAAGIVQIADASLSANDSTISAAGQFALNPNGNGRLSYKVAVGQASAWLAIAGQRGSGRVDLSGQAEGNRRNLRTTGSAELSAIRVNHFSAEHARLTYQLAGLGLPLRPAGQLMLLATGLHAGVDLKSLQTGVRLNAGTTLGATVDLAAEDRFSRPASLHADIAYRSGLVNVNLTRMAIATPQGSWQLAAPALLVKRGSAIEIHRFLATNASQSLALDGTLSQTGTQNLTARVQGMRIADFSSFFPKQIRIAGLASSEITLRGTAAAPVIAISTSVAGLNVAGLPQAGFSARMTYTDGRAQAEATLSQSAAHALTANATLPVELSWARGFESRITGNVDLRVVSAGLDVAVLNAIRNPEIGELGGDLSLDVTAHGPLLHPIPRGFIRLSGGRALIRQTKVQITGAAGDIQLEPGQVRLASLTARAGNGTMTGSGALSLAPDGTPGQLNLRIALDQWPAIATHQYNATIAANIDVAGPPTAVNVGGQIHVLYGVFRPDLSVTGSAPRPDETVTVVHRWSEAPPQQPPAQVPAGAVPLPPGLAIDLRIRIDPNTWIKTADFAVEMEGDVHIHKKRGGSLIVYGTINTVHGTVVVAQRQFDLTRGQIRFTGGHDINPELDIVAQRRVQNYLISVTVGGDANKPTLTLSSIPDLPQADILSVMMFGKPSSQLTGGQQTDLQNQAISMAGGYAASQVGQAVAQALGLGELGVTTGSGGVGFGRYLTKNVYVSASQSASDMQDRKAEIQYYVTPEINLGTSASTNYGNEIKLQWHKEY